MRKLMVLVVLLALALIAAPAIAQNEESTTPDTPNGGPLSDGAGASLPEPPAQEPPAQKNTPPETPVLEPPVSDPPAPEPPAQMHEGPVSDTNADDPSPTPGDFTSTGSGSDVADGPDGRTRDNTDKDEIADDDEVDAEARKDRLADRILAQLRDGKNDDDDEDDEDSNKDDVEQSQDQDANSGDADQNAEVINTGDNVNQCVGILQVANTGNAQNAAGITQYDSEADEVELEDGSRVTLTPQLVVDCRQIILQIVRGERPNESKISKAGLREVIRPTRGAALANRTGAGVIVPSSRSGVTVTPKVLSASSAGRPAGQPRTSARSLPRTGGSYATLVGLGTGALLVGGGLLVRRLAR